MAKKELTVEEKLALIKRNTEEIIGEEELVELLTNKEKLKHLPINFFFCLSSWFVPFLLITSLTEINTKLAVAISFYIFHVI